MPLNNRILIPIDSRTKNHAEFLARFKPVLEHWKFPVFYCDIRSPKFIHQLQRCGLIFLIQPGMGQKLSPSVLEGIEFAVENGAGLFVADPFLLANPKLHEFSFAKHFPRTRGRFKANTFSVVKNNHFIASTKLPREVIRVEDEVTILKVHGFESQFEVVVTSKRSPVFLFNKKRRIGFSMMDPSSLIHGLGFGTELDVFYWKSLIFLARKPLAQLRPEPMITVRIEDCVGEGKFKYLDFLIKQGFSTHLGLDLNDFDFSLKEKLRRYVKRGSLEFSPHAFTHYKRTPTEKTELIYTNFSGKEYSKNQLAKNFSRIRQFEKQSGLKFSRVLTYHYCQLGKRALPFLKKMGIRYFTFPFLTQTKLSKSLQKPWSRKPFGKLGLICDVFPEDPDFSVITSHRFPEENKSLRDKKMDVSVTSRLDFLYGLRLKAPGKHFTQYDEAVDRVFRTARWAYENLFFANIFTHETLINYLSLKEFQTLVLRLKKMLRKFVPKHLLYTDIANLTWQRFQAQIVGAHSNQVQIQGAKGSMIDLVIYRSRGRKIQMIHKKLQLRRAHERIPF